MLDSNDMIVPDHRASGIFWKVLAHDGYLEGTDYLACSVYDRSRGHLSGPDGFVMCCNYHIAALMRNAATVKNAPFSHHSR